MKRAGATAQSRNKKAKTASASAPTPSAAAAPIFPGLSVPVPLELQRLDQPGLALVPDFFSARECTALIALFSQPGLQPPRPPAKDEAARTNWRWSGQDPAFADVLWKRFGSLLDSLEGAKGTRAKGMNSGIRVYRYAQGQSFGRHYDDSIFCRGLRSEWTLLVYLTGEEDGVQGGETVFYPEARVMSKKGAGATLGEARIALRRGLALLHRHGRECALHEGAPVLKGTKWVLRSDVLFGKP
ncbi:hypothetical protein AURDEDRAFT_154766 [Auricularia subglabra TFB-10046 SS5]|nr:hypothetical protein AURDEDRAFT_154766 [Auricularia subglabra TFB-10046 SS5]